MISLRLKLLIRTVSETGYLFLVLLTVVTSGLSCVALLSQAVRTSDKQSWTGNINALVIGASYVIVLVASVLYCGKRRLAVRLRLQRISKEHNGTVGRTDLPAKVHTYVAQEFVRTCLVTYEALPKDVHHEGWGRPGTKYSNIQFRRALLDTVPKIDTLAHIVIPTHPSARPHVRMLHRFRFILPLLPEDQDGLTPLHYYDSGIQLARNDMRELSAEEFEVAFDAAQEILQCLNECQLEMMEGSSTQLDQTASN